MTERMIAGDTKTLTIRVTDAAGEVVDLTEATELRFEIFGPYGGMPFVAKALGSGVELTVPQTGLFAVTLLPEDTESLAGLHHFEAEMTMPNPTAPPAEIVATVVRGLLNIEPGRITIP